MPTEKVQNLNFGYSGQGGLARQIRRTIKKW